MREKRRRGEDYHRKRKVKRGDLGREGEGLGKRRE